MRPQAPGERYDVAILGGGLAGLTLALQLKRARPETSIVVAEQRKGPAPEAAFKVGESTVEISSHYFAEVLGLRDHLEQHQLHKAGLRFFFPSGDNRDIARRAEFGAVALPPVPSYQLDRGRFENELAARNLSAGTDLFDGCVVEQVELRDDDHCVTLSRDGDTSSVAARWVVDATGRAATLKRQLGLSKGVEHHVNASWFRLAGGLDLEEWADDEAWLARISERGLRKLSTNHLMGQGYWVWLIPLASGAISIGIVADPRYHPFDGFNELAKAMEWIAKHEPQLAEALTERREDVEDFLKIEDFSLGCERVFSPDRWCLAGEAGVFADAFYSPGSDMIALGNTFIGDLILRDLAGEEVGERADGFNFFYLFSFDGLMALYTDQYEVWGNAQVMMAKIVWDWLLYWGLVATRFYHGKFTDLEFTASVVEHLQRGLGLQGRMQPFFREWHRLDDRSRDGAFLEPLDVPFLHDAHLDLVGNFDDATLSAKIAERAELLQAFAVVLFHKAAELLPNAPDADARINPAAISLDPGRWEQEGMFDGQGFTLAEALSKTGDVENIWLEPAEASSPA